MWIAEFSESSDFWTQMAPWGYSPWYVCFSVFEITIFCFLGSLLRSHWSRLRAVWLGVMSVEYSMSSWIMNTAEKLLVPLFRGSSVLLSCIDGIIEIRWLLHWRQSFIDVVDQLQYRNGIFVPLLLCEVSSLLFCLGRLSGSIYQTWNQARLPAELKHIIKRRRRK